LFFDPERGLGAAAMSSTRRLISSLEIVHRVDAAASAYTLARI
jgi:hypothetical protein